MRENRPLIRLYEIPSNPDLQDDIKNLKEVARWIGWIGSALVTADPILTGISGTIIQGIRFFVVDP